MKIEKLKLSEEDVKKLREKDIKKLREEKDKLQKIMLSEEFQGYPKMQRVEVVKKYNNLSKRILEMDVKE